MRPQAGGKGKGSGKRMTQGGVEMTLSDPSRGFRFSKPLAGLAALTVVLLAGSTLKAQNAEPPIADMTAQYHFLSADHTLAILDEEGRLKGCIEVASRKRSPTTS